MRIVIVDDEPFFLDQLRSKLAQFGAGLQTSFDVVAECYSGQEALSRIAELSPDAVFTDIRMASIDGIELAKAVHAAWPQLPVVIISGYPLFEYALEAMRAGVADYLVKPLDSAALKTVLLKLLNQVGKTTYLKRKAVLRSCIHSSGASAERGGGRSVAVPVPRLPGDIRAKCRRAVRHCRTHAPRRARRRANPVAAAA